MPTISEEARADWRKRWPIGPRTIDQAIEETKTTRLEDSFERCMKTFGNVCGEDILEYISEHYTPEDIFPPETLAERDRPREVNAGLLEALETCADDLHDAALQLQKEGWITDAKEYRLSVKLARDEITKAKGGDHV